MKKFDLFAFIVILHHFHLLFKPEKPEDLSKIMQFLKRNITRNINFVLGATFEGAINESLLRMEGGLRNSRMKDKNLRYEGKLDTSPSNEPFLRLGDKYKEFQNEIEALTLRIIELRQQFITKYGQDQTLFPKFRWQKSFRDHYIRNQPDFDEHIRYISENPLKHQIPDPQNYKYIFTNFSELIGDY